MKTDFLIHVRTKAHRWQGLFAVMGMACGLASTASSVTAAQVFSFDLVTASVGTTGLCNGPSGAVASIQNLGAGSVPDIRCGGLGVSVTASGSTEFGALRALADIRFNQFTVAPPATSSNFEAKVRSGFFDTLLFSPGAATWQVTVGVSGQSVVILDGVAHDGNVGWCFNVLSSVCSSNGAVVANLGVATFNVPIPKTGILQINPTLIIDLNAAFTDNSSPATVDLFADLSNTAKFLSSQVLDANGDPIIGAQISADSGFNYIRPIVSVPVPTCVAGFAIGLASLFGVRFPARWRKS